MKGIFIPLIAIAILKSVTYMSDLSLSLSLTDLHVFKGYCKEKENFYESDF